MNKKQILSALLDAMILSGSLVSCSVNTAENNETESKSVSGESESTSSS